MRHYTQTRANKGKGPPPHRRILDPKSCQECGHEGRPDQACNLPYISAFLCHAFILESGYDIRTVQEFLGHNDVKTTMVYTYVLNRGPVGVRSPVDELWGRGLIRIRIRVASGVWNKCKSLICKSLIAWSLYLQRCIIRFINRKVGSYTDPYTQCSVSGRNWKLWMMKNQIWKEFGSK